MGDRAPLPPVVNAVGDRIKLDYRLDRKSSTRKYVADTSKYTRMDLEWLSKSYYSLSELRTKESAPVRKEIRSQVKNPLKLNSKLRKQLYKLSKEEKQGLRYAMFAKVHEIWLQYVEKVMSERDPLKLFRMDLHGCKLKCTASKNPLLVGSEGIVVQETRNTFLIISQTNRLLTLPKRESIFEFAVGEKTYRLHGCNLLFTAQTRSKVKFKQRKCLLSI